MRKFNLSIILILLFGVFHTAQAFWFGEEESIFETSSGSMKKVTVIDEGLSLPVQTKAGKVKDLLEELSIQTSDEDVILPQENKKINSGSRVVIQRSKKYSLLVEGESVNNRTSLQNVQQVLWENDVDLDKDDIVLPSKFYPVSDEMDIQVIRVVIKEEIKNESIDFKTVVSEDDELGWRIRKVTQKGVDGILEKKYSVAYHDGKEVSRNLKEKNIIKDPIEEIVVQGTYVKIGKSHKGLASWYSHTGTMAAASPWLPMGSYAKVTNRDTGKSVMVKINDRGPFSPGKIIDLDKVAFQKLAPLGQGVFNVKVEEVLN